MPFQSRAKLLQLLSDTITGGSRSPHFERCLPLFERHWSTSEGFYRRRAFPLGHEGFSQQELRARGMRAALCLSSRAITGRFDPPDVHISRRNCGILGQRFMSMARLDHDGSQHTRALQDGALQLAQEPSTHGAKAKVLRKLPIRADSLADIDMDEYITLQELVGEVDFAANSVPIDAFPVSAFYVGTALKLSGSKDIASVTSRALPRVDVRSKLSRRGGFGGTILLYASPRGDSAFPTTGSQDIKVEDVFRDPNVMPRGVVVFDFGAVVTVGLDPATEKAIVQTLSRLEKKASLDALKDFKDAEESFEKHLRTVLAPSDEESFLVDVRPGQSHFSALRGNVLYLQTMDVDSVRVIATALAQSVAMDHYSRLTDVMMEEFERLSIGLQRAGGRFNVPKKKLFALVAQTNLVMIDVVRNIGVMERSEPAWEDERYDRLWDSVRKDLELIDRFTTLKTKVQMIQDSSKVYLDIMNNRRSDMHEVAIVVLISLEIVVMLIQIGVDAGVIDASMVSGPVYAVAKLVRDIYTPISEMIWGEASSR